MFEELMILTNPSNHFTKKQTSSNVKTQQRLLGDKKKEIMYLDKIFDTNETK